MLMVRCYTSRWLGPLTQAPQSPISPCTAPQVFWNTKEMDKAKVNMALQRAHSIDLESAHEVLQKHSEQLQAENERLKHLISVFIEGMHDDDYEEAFPVPQLEPIPEEGEDGMSSGTHAGPDDLSHGSPR